MIIREHRVWCSYGNQYAHSSIRVYTLILWDNEQGQGEWQFAPTKNNRFMTDIYVINGINSQFPP